MKRVKRLLLTVGFVCLLAVSWLVAITADSDVEKQGKLVSQAKAYLQDEVYIRAVPLLEEAASYTTEQTLQIETQLKEVYLKLIDKDGFLKKYRSLLNKQMSRPDALADVYYEAAEHYLNHNKTDDAFEVFRSGIQKTGDVRLTEYYESVRYQYKTKRSLYEDVTAFYNGTIAVCQNGLWGIIASDGDRLLPCEYDAVSTFCDDRAFVQKGNVFTAVDQNNNRLVLLHEEASAIGNYAENRLALCTREGWRLATGELQLGSTVFQQLGMYAEGYAAAQVNGKWGIVNAGGKEWLLEPQFDRILCDSLGRCYSGGAVFVEKNGQVMLLVDGEPVGEVYEDAKPFADGWAAVKKNGKWGFIDRSGEMKIQPMFEDALSFSGHLAAVKIDGLWGYVSLYGKVVIEPVFFDVRNFYQGTAPVKTDRGWQFITLLEYEESASL